MVLGALDTLNIALLKGKILKEYFACLDLPSKHFEQTIKIQQFKLQNANMKMRWSENIRICFLFKNGLECYNLYFLALKSKMNTNNKESKCNDIAPF